MGDGNPDMTRKSIILLAGVAASCAVTALFAHDSDNKETKARDAAESHVIQREPNAIDAVKASTLLGREIHDENGHRIGKVRELALDMRNGRIAEIIVGTGGFLGFGEKEIAVPPAEFSWNPQSRKLVCQLEAEQLRNAPSFDSSQWIDSTTTGKVREVYHRYNVVPYFVDENIAKPPASETKPAEQLTASGMAAPTEHLGPLRRAHAVIDAPVNNPEGDKVGRAENIIVDVAAGRIVVLIVSTGSYLDMGNEVSAIPAQAFKSAADGETLRLDTTREALRTTPHFKPNQWPGIATLDRIDMVYDAFSVPAYRTTFDIVNTAQNVRERSDNSLASSNEVPTAADRAISARIRREIMTRSDLSPDAQNIKILTVNGQVTLRGSVKNKAEEQAITEIAKNAAAQNSKVTNQIQTISKPPSN